MDNLQLLKSVENRLYDHNEEVRYSAVKELLQVHSSEVVPLLMKAVGDSSYRIREEALKGICSFPTNVIFPELEGFLRDQENANLRTAAMEAFPRYGNEATPYLLRLLKDPDKEVRMFSANILGEIRDPASVADLIDVLKDPDENVKHASAESLGKIGDARAVKSLIDCLHQDFWIQYPAVIALGNIGDLSATEHLVKLLDDEMLREAVIEALGKIGDISVVPVLAHVLSQNNPSLRNDTIASLVNIQQTAKVDEMALSDIKNELNNDRVIDHLIHSLKDPDTEIQKNAIIVLGWLREERAIGHLVELLNDYELEEYVVGYLVSMGDKALPELISKLQDPDPKIQTSIIRCIYWIGHIDGIKACIPFLKNQNSEVRYHAVMAMSGGLDSEDVEDALLELLSDPNREVQTILVEILGKSRSKQLVNKLINALSSEVLSRKLMSIQILSRLKNYQSCEHLEKLLEDPMDAIRDQAYTALSAIKADQLLRDILIKGIKDKSYTMRKAVAQCLKEKSGENLEDTLLMLLRNPDPGVRFTTIETMGKIGGTFCIEDLIANFSDSNKQLRLAIVQAMGNIRDQYSTDFLTELLKEADPDLKQTAIDSLGRIKDKRSTSELITALDDSNWIVRSAAIQALTRIGGQNCTAHILKKLEDPEDIIKKEAILALGLLASKDAVNSILPLALNEKLQPEVLSTLEKLGLPDLDGFRTIFKRSNSQLKCHLIDLLGRIKDSRALDFLIGALNEEFYGVRCQAVKALNKLDDPKAIAPLQKVLKEDSHEEVRNEARHAIEILKARA